MTVTIPQLSILSFTEMASSISEIHQAHAQLLKTGDFYRNTLASNKLISFAVSNPDPNTLSYAHSVLTHITTPNSFSYNSLLRAYANSLTPQNALFLFCQMLQGPVFPDKYSFTFALKACAAFGGVEEGRQIHGQALKLGIGFDVFVANTLIGVYSRSGCFGVARILLDKMTNRDVISWNALLSAYIEKGFISSARRIFDEMEQRNIESWNFMISGYLSHGLLEEAKSIFDSMPVKDVVSWNAMITGYAHASCFGEVLKLFEDMQRKKVRPDSCTLVNVLSACAHLGALGQGEWIHGYIDKNGIGIYGFIATALVDMYSKCGNIEKALNVFRNASKTDISTWNSIIVGLGMHGFGEKALDAFSEMLAEGFEPNEVTFIAVLSACSRSGLLNEGHKMFRLMVDDYGIEPTIEHYGCMVDLLGRVGLLEEALELLETRPLQEAHVLWESLLSACKNHGNLKMAEDVARRLLELNLQDSAGYVQLSNAYAALKRWDDVSNVRQKMKALKINKEPGCSMIEVDGVVQEFLAGEGLIIEQI
ncbi:Pentatricopeptide repeat-containing protein [Hibiscus syriacus]|uniref:Pentatricopeptide repeat-containing protein n=1 Tax=Hibiscus syriacus TaxID=106335 RepID=A0A6A3ANU5_HIBSY|nr:pentatricopeptide repeat-containing protein At4g18840 [Hibiscus syriacus]KAE8704542.1 Pentatricopeptide repeat-containing protein [Hibiscus syriacus]